MDYFLWEACLSQNCSHRCFFLRFWSGRGRTGTCSTFTLIVAKGARVSRCTFSFCFAQKAISLLSFNSDGLSFASAFSRCSCHGSFVSGLQIASSHFLIQKFLHHGFFSRSLVACSSAQCLVRTMPTLSGADPTLEFLLSIGLPEMNPTALTFIGCRSQARSMCRGSLSLLLHCVDHLCEVRILDPFLHAVSILVSRRLEVRLLTSKKSIATS